MTPFRLMIPILLSFLLVGCENGYELGPLERGLRTIFHGWDMWNTEAVSPYESPLPQTVEGTVQRDDHFSIEKGRSDIKQLSKEQRKKKGELAYRRYCHHCHGPNGDGRIIVGESLEIPPADLRDADIQSKTEEELFTHIQEGGELMLPLAQTLSPAEMLLSAEYVKTLKDRPSTPYYKPQFDKPIQQ